MRDLFFICVASVILAFAIAYSVSIEFRSYFRPSFYHEIKPEYVDPDGKYIEYKASYYHMIKGNVVRSGYVYDLTKAEADSLIEKEKRVQKKYKEIFNTVP